MSPFRPSFSPHPQHASTDHRFLSPLFSQRYELLFPQLFCFHNHLRCPLVFSSRCIFPRRTHKTGPRVTTFRMNTCKNVSKQRTLSPSRMNTYEKPGGRGAIEDGLPLTNAMPSAAWRHAAGQSDAYRHAARAFASSVVVGIVSSFDRSEKVIDNQIRYLAAQTLAGSKVGAEMYAGENPA